MSILINMTAKAMATTGLVCFFFFGVLSSGEAQTGFGMRWNRQPELEVVAMFDRNGDGRLNDRERRAARKYVREQRAGRDLPAGSQQVNPIKSLVSADLRQSAAAAVPSHIDLYDQTVMRTLYLRFPDPDWQGELADFFRTDVEVPADLIVDGKLYTGVGVRFRGNSSYFMLGNSPKKSFSISIDHSVQNAGSAQRPRRSLVSTHGAVFPHRPSVQCRTQGQLRAAGDQRGELGRIYKRAAVQQRLRPAMVRHD
jgi:hypothetical protein